VIQMDGNWLVADYQGLSTRVELPEGKAEIVAAAIKEQRSLLRQIAMIVGLRLSPSDNVSGTIYDYAIHLLGVRKTDHKDPFDLAQQIKP